MLSLERYAILSRLEKGGKAVKLASDVKTHLRVDRKSGSLILFFSLLTLLVHVCNGNENCDNKNLSFYS